MKQLLSSVVLLISLMNYSNAQTSIVFSGEDNAGGYVRLHHVIVSNLSQQWCDTLFYPDTTLLLSAVGVEEHVANPDFQISRIRPNPMNGTTELAVQLPYEDEVVVEVLDMSGSLLVTYSVHLDVGEHYFRVNLSTMQAYLLVVKTRKESVSVKLLNVGNSGGNHIEHCGSGPLHQQTKSARSEIHPFESGDQMRYVGFLNIDSTEVVSDTIEKIIDVDNLETLRFTLWVTVDSIDIPIQVPGVYLNPVSEITNVSASFSASLTNNVPVESVGFCWGTSPAPSINDFSEIVSVSQQTSDFNYTLSDLVPGTTLYVRAFAVTSQGVFYSMSERMFSTTPIPLVSTAPVMKTSDSTAFSGGEVPADGGLPIISRGVCWSTSSQPDISCQHTNDGTGTGSFSSVISGLTIDSVYYVRAYATNSYGTAYGETRIYRPILPAGDAQPCAGAATMTDYDGNVYATVKIGEQCWMRENLKTTHFSDGTPIPLSVGTTSWTVAYCYSPNAQSSNISSYGLLYNWAAAMNGANGSGANPSGVQGVCPSGWHLPSFNEWTQLAGYVSGNPAYLCDTIPGVLSARNGKAFADTTGWHNSDEYCVVGNEQSQNNSTGFSAKPAGYLDVTYDNAHHHYEMFHEGASFWSSTQFVESGTYMIRAYIAAVLYELDFMMLNGNGGAFYNVAELKNCAMSVRCVKD